VHHYQEGVKILVVDYDADQENGEVAQAEVAKVADAVCGRGEVQGVFELEIFIAEVQLVEEEEQQAVGQHATLVVPSPGHRAEEVEVVQEERPLEEQHLVDIRRTQGGSIGPYGEIV
jgi:hypothetical protein